MARTRPLRDLALAVTLLTALPLPVREASADERVDVASWFPLVGLVIGVALAGVVWVSNRFFYGLSGVGAAVLLFAVALVTRLLHWDGLADVADAWFVPRDRRLEVLGDSRVGAFAVVTVIFVALIQWSALVEIASSEITAALVVLVPVFGRLAATFSAWFGTAARPGGLGASVVGRPTGLGAFVTFACAGVCVWVPLYLGVDATTVATVAAVSFVLALVVPHLIALRFGGVTGDTMGASVLVVETLVMVSVLSVVAVLRVAGLSA